MDIGYALGYANLYMIDLTPENDVPTWARLASGITSVEPSDKDKTSSDYYYDGGGDAETSVTGATHAYKVKGDRRFGDPAQDYIARKRFDKGQGRETNFCHIYPDGTKLTTRVSLTDITDNGGKANEKGSFGCTINTLGSPQLTEANGDDMPETITATAMSVAVGATSQLEPQVMPATSSEACAYGSSDVKVATVSDSGLVTGVAVGKCSVTIKSVVAPTVEASVDITVTAKALTSGTN
ncbi:MAG: Ig-like domain-containing protein [Eggerthellaceae bacterium]|jgi:hypothetical protein|nr:Ig-like domain-containing protein [Eggerthellaceae bacterium]MCH4220486.1 Ig-like domain-containing protein [Eggerthellaceae bacterium]